MIRTLHQLSPSMLRTKMPWGLTKPLVSPPRNQDSPPCCSEAEPLLFWVDSCNHSSSREWRTCKPCSNSLWPLLYIFYDSKRSTPWHVLCFLFGSIIEILSSRPFAPPKDLGKETQPKITHSRAQQEEVSWKVDLIDAPKVCDDSWNVFWHVQMPVSFRIHNLN